MNTYYALFYNEDSGFYGIPFVAPDYSKALVYRRRYVTHISDSFHGVVTQKAYSTLMGLP